MRDLVTTLAVYRPSKQWTVLFQHAPYAPALWALLFNPDETLLASEHFGSEWPQVSAGAVIADHVVGYRTSAGKARERLVERLGPIRGFAEAWRVFSLTRALALSLAALPEAWPLRLDASNVTVKQGSRYGDLLAAGIGAAARLDTEPPRSDLEAVRALVAMAHGLNPETPFHAPADDAPGVLYLRWPEEGQVAGRNLLGRPVDCPSNYVEAMTRARHRWEASW
jgi:hypothetical protein